MLLALKGLTAETDYQGEFTLNIGTRCSAGLGMFIEEVLDGKMVTASEPGPRS